MWIKYMKKTDDLPDDVRKIVRDAANNLWEDRFGNMSQIAGIAMTLGVIAGFESVMGNLKRKGNITRADMHKGMKGEPLNNMIDSFQGLPLNVIGSLSNSQIYKLTHAIREHMVEKIAGDDRLIKNMAKEMIDFIENQLDIPSQIMGSLEDSTFNRQKKSAAPSEFADQLAKYWETKN